MLPPLTSFYFSPSPHFPLFNPSPHFYLFFLFGSLSPFYFFFFLIAYTILAIGLTATDFVKAASLRYVVDQLFCFMGW
jgi:hypothetical protein